MIDAVFTETVNVGSIFGLTRGKLGIKQINILYRYEVLLNIKKVFYTDNNQNNK